MNIIKTLKDKLGKKLGLTEEKNKTEEIIEQRDDIKLEISTKLYQIGCNDDEIEKVLNIIKNAEDDIQIIKNSLIGTNINPTGDPMEALSKGQEKIKIRQSKMQKELQETISSLVQKYSS